MVRGAIVELRPREQITLRLATGKVVIVPWSDVHHVEQGGPVAATCTSGSGTASAPLDEAGTVTLALEGDGFTLEAKIGTEWGSVCVSPCRAEVPRNGYYRVNGPMIRPSTPFRAQGKAGDVVRVKVDPASSGAFAAGVVSVTAGGVLLFVAYVEALEVLGGSSSSYYDSSYSYYGSSRRSSSDHGTLMLGSLAAGFAATILGGALLHGNMRTAVSQVVSDAVHARPKAAPEPSRVAPFKEAWFKRPSALDPKPAPAIPVMTGTF